MSAGTRRAQHPHAELGTVHLLINVQLNGLGTRLPEEQNPAESVPGEGKGVGGPCGKIPVPEGLTGELEMKSALGTGVPGQGNGFRLRERKFRMELG